MTPTGSKSLSEKLREKILSGAMVRAEYKDIGDGKVSCVEFFNAEFINVLLSAVDALQLTMEHYKHPMHDHNWAYYIYDGHKKILERLEKLVGK